MIQQMTNRQLAQEINARIGNAPIPFDSVYSIALQIYQELGGEENDFDSVYSILLEILPLAESVANKTSITEVDELPDAYDNNNIYRLSSDDKVYMSKHVSTDYSDKLPDAQQIDKAILYVVDDEPYYYKGAWKIKSIYDETELNGYGWLITTDGGWYLVITQYDFVHTTVDTKCFDFNSFEEYHYEVDVDFENQTVNIGLDYNYLQWELKQTLGGYGMAAVVPATYNAPEANQIGNAEITSEMSALYNGEEITFYCSPDGEYYTGYKWGNGSDDCIATLKPASEIYCGGEHGEFSNTLVYDLTYDNENQEWVSGDYSEDFQIVIKALNAPESEQVDKAYLHNSEMGDYICKGIINAVFTDGALELYCWEYSDGGDDWFFTLPSETDFYANKIKATEFDDLGGLSPQQDGSFKTDEITVNQALAVLNPALVEFGLKGVVKYQRVIENWEWKQIPTMDDIPQLIEIKLEDIGGTEMNKLNGFTETGVYNNVDIKVKIDGDYYSGLLTVTVLHSYQSHPEKIDIWQEIRIFGYSDAYMVEDWVVQRVSLDGVWDAAQMMLLSHSAE